MTEFPILKLGQIALFTDTSPKRYVFVNYNICFLWKSNTYSCIILGDGR